jgi:hypothetical protein
MTFDHQTDEYAVDALDRIAPIPDAMKPIASAGIMHAGLAVLADCLGHGLTTEILRDMQRQLDHWRDGGEIGL